jgi:hypothetical protein
LTPVRKSSVFLIYLAVNLILLALMLVHAGLARKAETNSLAAKSEMVEELGITDLCLFTEASYTRHLSQSDVFTPFQDGPSLPDHFPSGGVVRPPQALMKPNEKLD